MKKVKVKRILRVFAIRGFFIGLFITMLIILLGLNSEAFHNTDRTVTDFIKVFPGLWVVFVLPILFSLSGFWLANNLGRIIKKQNQSLVDELGEGHFDNELTIRSEEDHLGHSLNRLRDNMINNKHIEEKRRIEEEQRTWVTNGVAQFAEILRRN